MAALFLSEHHKISAWTAENNLIQNRVLLKNDQPTKGAARCRTVQLLSAKLFLNHTLVQPAQTLKHRHVAVVVMISVLFL